ncbi:hypothetical protein GCM10018781_44740 [Kitasatospora indigofera]|uniref:Uncharacterized protein n=1 Tax=Kitasatospora indigofera TaxID=67307 RepID=A0A919G1R0_9ACTN|nr:hypothetical protein GCM10018781_44740 [Kitasatospora indigofera]
MTRPATGRASTAPAIRAVRTRLRLVAVLVVAAAVSLRKVMYILSGALARAGVSRPGRARSVLGECAGGAPGRVAVVLAALVSKLRTSAEGIKVSKERPRSGLGYQRYSAWRGAEFTGIRPGRAARMWPRSPPLAGDLGHIVDPA